MSLLDPEWADIRSKDEQFFGMRAVLLDYMHHDQPERHVIGGTLLAPNIVKGNFGVPSPGRSPAVAREDHVHGYDDVAWSSWTPNLLGEFTDPTLGAGNIKQGRYVQVGKLVVAQFRIIFGTSGTAAGNGRYFVTLPVSATVTFWNGHSIGVGRFWNAGGTYAGPYMATLPNTTMTLFEYPAAWPTGGLTYVGHATPWAWGANMELHGVLAYEAV